MVGSTPTINTTIVAALVHYALHVADPSFCIEALEEVYPERKAPWDEIIGEARNGYREVLDNASHSVRA